MENLEGENQMLREQVSSMQTDLTCAFHQGAPSHDVEYYYAFKKEVQNLVHTNMLSFNDPSSNVQSSSSA